MGCPEFGTVSLSELTSVKGRLGLGIERDLYFEADKPISAYGSEAIRLGRIRAWANCVAPFPSGRHTQCRGAISDAFRIDPFALRVARIGSMVRRSVPDGALSSIASPHHWRRWGDATGSAMDDAADPVGLLLPRALAEGAQQQQWREQWDSICMRSR